MYSQTVPTKWTSGNSDVDKLIQESQLNAKSVYEKLEWIEYGRFENIEYITKGEYIKQFGRMDLFMVGVMKLINGKDFKQIKDWSH